MVAKSPQSYWLALCIAVLGALAPCSVYADDQEYLLKAAFIYKFIQVVEWPGDKALSKQSHVDICLLGDVPQEEMAPIFAKASTSALHFSLVEEKNPKNLGHCQVVFFGPSEEKTKDILAALQGQPVLTIGSGDDFIEQGGMIGFVMQSNKIKFEVNTQAAAAAGMRVKAELLELAVQGHQVMAMQLLRNSSIRQRLTSIIMAVSCISVVLTTLAISVIGVYNLRNNIIGELDVSASIVGDRNTAALNFDTYDQTENNLSVFSVKQPIVQACLYDHKSLSGEIIDKMVAQYVNKAYPQSACPTDLTERTVVGKSRIELLKAIYASGGDKIGYLYIESTLEQVDNYIEKQTTIAMIVSVAALLVSYLLAISLQKAISRPILSLAAIARQVSRDKDYSIRAPSVGDAEEEFNNELVILTKSFNEMLTEIGVREQQLKTQNIALEKARDAAESANRAKSHFLANISHELRTPLNAIIGFSSILMNQLFGPLGDQKYWEYAKDINESGAHLLDIINDILDLSKAEAGRLALAYEEVHLGKSINKCITILSERAEKGKVAIVANIPKTLPPLVADRLRLIQILLNVLSNAVKFTGEGGTVQVNARTYETENQVPHIVITVQDNGIGMSKEDIDKAFQSFGQVDSGLNRKYEGTGLGLPLTKKLMELHYGTIRIDSELGKGALVTLTFPAVPPPESGYVPSE